MRAYLSDLRDRVVAAVMAGATVRSVADRFGVSVASAVKWSQRYRTTGSAAAKPRGGKKPYVLTDQREWLLARIAEAPDLALRAVMAELADRGVATRYHAVWDFFAHEGVTLKKACTPSNRPGRMWPGSGNAGSAIRRWLEECANYLVNSRYTSILRGHALGSLWGHTASVREAGASAPAETGLLWRPTDHARPVAYRFYARSTTPR